MPMQLVKVAFTTGLSEYLLVKRTDEAPFGGFFLVEWAIGPLLNKVGGRASAHD